MSCQKEHTLDTEHFKRICSLQLEDTIPFSMYKSEKTGITVCFAELDGPIINGYFNFVTQTLDDDGLPNTLGHLIFMGSEEYSYNNILKLWTDKCLIDEISSSPFCDRTYFTMRAAGSEAFLSMMPIYLNHILYPSLKDSAYLTQVHHINETRENAGPIYCYVRDEECKLNDVMYWKMMTTLYRKKCGYTSVYYGTTKNLRESSTIKKVKDFHNKFYKPDNLTILIMGKIQHNQIFQALHSLEEKIMSELQRKKRDSFKNPWQTPIYSKLEKLKQSRDMEATFPSNDDIFLVYVAWRGPSVVTQMYDYRGCLSLLTYLTKTSSSPLRIKFVEENNISITYYSYVHSSSVLSIIFTEVPQEKIDKIKFWLEPILSDLCNPGNSIHMKIKAAINDLINHQKCVLENNLHDTIASSVFDHVVYGNSNNDVCLQLDQRLNSIRDFEKLKKESEEYFKRLLEKYFVKAPMVVVKGKATRMNPIYQEEKNYVDKQIAQLGQEGLKQKEEELKQAMKEMKNVVPGEVLAFVPIPGTNSITPYDIVGYNTETHVQHPKLDVRKLPFFTYLDDVNTNFIYLQVVMDSSFLSEKDRYYIPLFMKMIINSPVKRNNQLIPYEKVKNSLEADIIECKSYVGINSENDHSQSISLMLQIELQNYEKGVQLCKELLYDTKITVKRLKLITTQLLHYNLERKIKYSEKCEANKIWDKFYIENSNQRTLAVINQIDFLHYVMTLLNTDVGKKEVKAKIKYVRETLTLSKNMFVHMAVNVNKLAEQVQDVYAPWNDFLSKFKNKSFEKIKPTLTAGSKLLSLNKGCIVSSKFITFSKLIQICPCINDFQDPNLPALMVSLKYFMQEGESKFKALSKSLFPKVDEGLLYLSLSTEDILSPYIKIKSIVETHIAKNSWNQYSYEKAKSSVIVDFSNEIKSISDMIKVLLKYHCRNLPHDYNYQMIQRVSAVTMNDMRRVTAMYVKPLFEMTKCRTFIVCNESKVAHIQKTFTSMNLCLEIVET